jgi:hypothetical protein
MSLSVVIPTTAKRFSIFTTIDSIFESTQGFDVKVEVVVNNLASNKKILDQLLCDNRIMLRFHDDVHDTAEASAMWAAYTSNSDWVWLLGDDDLASSESIKHILYLISIEDIDFWLLNLLLIFDVLPVEYYRIGPKPIQTSNAIRLWERCGFFSILTTISCLLIKRSILDIDLFEEFHKRQGVYSHSFALLAMLKNSQVGTTDFFCVLRNEEPPESIEKALSSYSASRKVNLNSIFTSGAIDLFELLSQKIDLSLRTLLNFREIEIIKIPMNSYLRKSDVNILVSSCAAFIHRFDASFLPLIFDPGEFMLEKLILPAPVRISLD